MTAFNYAQTYDEKSLNDEEIDEDSDSVKSDDSYYEECQEVGLAYFNK
tara:strand:- start:129 stop:272 length:144 start_codon:yes stop_codon:yes gene_type:complete